MPINRREILKMSLASAASLFFPLPFLAKRASAQLGGSRETLSIVQGATDESSTQFSIVHPTGTELRVLAGLGNGESRDPEKLVTLTFPGQAQAVTQAFFSSLPANEDLRLLVSNAEGSVLDERIFRTLATDKPNLKFAICSCMHDGNHEPAIWQDLSAQSPDLILFIGDSVYCDQGTQLSGEDLPARLWRRFAEARSILEIYHQKRLVPILAVWDDHDFGENDSNAIDFPYVQESKKNFLTYFPQDPAFCRFLESGPGISQCLSFRGQRILLLDDRSFRLRARSTERYAHWGEAQEGWAMQKVAEHNGATWLMNGSQFFPNAPLKESVSRDHPEQLAGLIQALKATQRKVLFASGDVHFSEISRIEPELLAYETFEITSSSIHSYGLPPEFARNPRRILSTGKRNYVLVTCERSGSTATFQVESRSPLGTHFQKTIHMSL